MKKYESVDEITYGQAHLSNIRFDLDYNTQGKNDTEQSW